MHKGGRKGVKFKWLALHDQPILTEKDEEV
jgi:hypothetical protein